jgi:predicted ribosome-associated RNA-binding protein Tma20
MKVQISYLGEIISDGTCHGGWSGGICYDGRKVESRRVEPTVVELPDLPVVVHAGWGDRGRSADELPVYTDPDANCIVAEANGRRVRVAKHAPYGLFDTDQSPAWLPSFIAAVAAIRAAAAAAELDRPEVATVCAGYRAVLRGIDEAHRAHEAQWQQDVVRIARKFRRATVAIGEQTVPGKVCVRSTRGRLLGYADCWDGRWLGTIERI